MSEEANKENRVSETINAVAGLAKSVPIYQDSVQPAAKEVGKSLETVAKTVNLVLTPLRAMIWSYDKLEAFLSTKVSEKLQNTPESDIQTPKANIAVPVLQSLMYSGEEPELQELYANLLAGAMDKHTAPFNHPSFVEAIKQMTPDEAKLLQYISLSMTTSLALPVITVRDESKKRGEGGVIVARHLSLLGLKANCENPELTPVSLDNLIRLGIIVIPKNYSYTEKAVYDEIKNHENVTEIVEDINKNVERRAVVLEETVGVTDFGKQFIDICVLDHRSHRP